MPEFKPEIVLAVTVSDFAKATEWYKSVLGCQEVYAMPEMGWGEYTTAINGVTIGIGTNEDGSAPTQGGGAAITLGVNDIDSVRSELEGKGVQFDGPTYEVSGMVKLANFKDPDGNPFMLAQTLQQPG
jgi:predicted enzyme related to lactoylglutathione lyase